MTTNVNKNFKDIHKETNPKDEKFNTNQLQQWLDATKIDETCKHQRKKVEKYIASLKKIENVVEEFCDKINDQKNKIDNFFTERCYSKEDDDFVELCEIDCGFWIVSTVPNQQKHAAENEAKTAKVIAVENEAEKVVAAENEAKAAKVSETTTTTIVPITPTPRHRWNPKRHLGTDYDKDDDVVDDGSKPKKYIIQYSTCDSRAHAQNALATLNAGYIQIPLKILTICLDKQFIFDELFDSSNQHYCDASLQLQQRTIVISTLGFEDVALAEQLKNWRNDVTNVNKINKIVKTDTTTIFNLNTKSCPENQLIDLVRPSLVGIGTETVYDPTIRKASEIGGGGGTVYFIPPIEMWNGIFRHVYEYFHRSINVQFDKVAVYTKGDFFEAHRDTVRAPNHIATLLIGTDYEYEGGEFTIGQSHKKTNANDDNETSHSYKLDKKSFLLFYTDTLHSVERVTSGTRVVLQFKVFLADSAMPSDFVVITPSTSFATSFAYSPGNSAPFYSKNEFCDQITSKDHENFDNIQDAYYKYSSNKDNESIASADNKDYIDSFIVQSSPKSPSSIEIAPNILGEILVAHRSKHFLGLVLNHFYPQKHIEPKFLRGNDKLVYDMLLKNEHVKSLVLTPIHLIRVWSYCDDSDKDSMNLRVPKEFYDAHKYLAVEQLSLFVHNKQKLEEIIKLSSSVYPNGNEGVSATGEYWYAAAMCLVEFVF